MKTTDFLLKPTPHKEAMAWIASKPIVSRQAFDKLLPELKARAFTITGIESANVLQSVRDRLADLPSGADWDAIKGDLVDDISPFLVDPQADPETRDAQIAAAARRAELLLRTHGFQAYQAAQFEVMDRQKDALPFWKYLAVEDDRVRPAHAALDGLVLPADDPFWADHWPPWDWGCRCQVIPLTQVEADEIASGQDTSGRLLSPVETKRLNNTGQLALDNGQVIDVSSPRARGKEGAFYWNPGDLRIPPAELQKRYDPAVWKQFEQFAQNTKLENGATLWDWLNGAALSKAAKKAVAPKSIIPSAAPAGAPIRQSPVSQALKLDLAGAALKAVKQSLAAIDKVHDDGKLPLILVNGRAGRDLGLYTYSHAGGAVKIGIKKTGPWPRLTACHEVGHFLDHQAIGNTGRFASENIAGLQAWRDAVDKSTSIRDIKNAKISAKRKAEFLSYTEKFARSYAQYIAQKSGDPDLLTDLQKIRACPQSWRQWDNADFVSISKAFDELFNKLGWL